MKKRVIRLNENDIERLVKKIIKEGEDSVGSSDRKISSKKLGSSTIDVGKDLRKGGLAPKERETLNDAITMLTAFFKQPGNQATGAVFNKFNMLKKELIKLSREIEPTDDEEESN